MTRFEGVTSGQRASTIDTLPAREITQETGRKLAAKIAA
ncbi:protein of unknown function [Paraburkholderia dioscoreae]|uniref:Uncharacterized protein n=1 Tax=Paraburkholderia dioscoreae TaxID=2604047 RepID=A0A5Q4ZEC5_9BURK|nr:protein of unknown function [Paraburkholderia dioscoreae]